VDTSHTISTVSFHVEKFKNGIDPPWVVTPAIDGQPLTELIEAYEKARQYEPAGSYGGLIPQYFKYGPLDRYFMGEVQAKDRWANGIWLLGCDCGEVGCWPLECRVRRDGEMITWEAFSQPYRQDRDYSEFGPFVFHVDQYRNTVNDLVTRLDSLLPTT